MSPIGTAGVDKIVKEVRALSSQENLKTVTPIFTDDTIKNAIQRASDELYYDIVQQGVGFFTKRLDFGHGTNNPLLIPEVINSDQYASIILPDDFYQILFLLYRCGTYSNEWYLSKALELSSKSDTLNNARFGHYILSRPDKDELVIIPDVDLDSIRQSQYILEYVPESIPVEQLRIPRGWSNYFVYSAALEITAADFNKINQWELEAMKLKNKIIEWAENRSPFNEGYIKRVQRDDATIEDIDGGVYSYLSSIVSPYGGIIRG